jgi:antitoxin CptB
MSDPEMAKLRWRCRRGMRELDMLLLNYLERSYTVAGPDEQRAFKLLLTIPDPEILALLTARSVTDDEHLAHVIQRLLDRN